MPDAPLPPVGPFTERTPKKITAADGKTIRVTNAILRDDYISFDHQDPGNALDLFEMMDCIGYGVGSFLYCGAHKSTNPNGNPIKVARFHRIRGNNQKTGRPAFRPFGAADLVEARDIDIDYGGVPNTSTGNIATVFQVGEKWSDTLTGAALEADKAKKRVKLFDAERIRCTGIVTNWPDDDYYNGDALTCEQSVDLARIRHLFAKQITDGGVDLKCKSEIDLIRVEEARAAVKLWANSTIKRLVSINPLVQGGVGGTSHLRIQGNNTSPPTIIVESSYLIGNEPHIRIENAPVLIRGFGYFEGPSPLKLANGGSLVAGSTWNGQAIS